MEAAFHLFIISFSFCWSLATLNAFSIGNEDFFIVSPFLRYYDRIITTFYSLVLFVCVFSFFVRLNKNYSNFTINGTQTPFLRPILNKYFPFSSKQRKYKLRSTAKERFIVVWNLYLLIFERVLKMDTQTNTPTWSTKLKINRESLRKSYWKKKH